MKKTKKGQCFRLFSTLKNIKICLIWRMFTFFRNVNIRQIKQIFIFFNVENSRKHCPFFKILKCSHLFTPSHAFSWPHKIEDLCLVQVIILALILCGIVAMEYGWLEMFMRYKGMLTVNTERIWPAPRTNPYNFECSLLFFKNHLNRAYQNTTS